MGKETQPGKTDGIQGWLRDQPVGSSGGFCLGVQLLVWGFSCSIHHFGCFSEHPSLEPDAWHG